MLRKEVADLWKRRKDNDVVEMLAPFMVREAGNDSHLVFHNAVMQMKCSKLSEDERQDLQAWIEEEVKERWDIIKHPWKHPQAKQVDELTTENEYVQRYSSISLVVLWPDQSPSYMDMLPPVLQGALEEIERVTGLKSLLLIGGPIPALNGKISTHL